MIKKFNDFINENYFDDSELSQTPNSQFTHDNILYFNEPFCLHIGENLKFICMFSKGKKAKNIFDYRPLFEGETTGKKYILIVTEHPFFGVNLDFTDVSDLNKISDSHYKLKNYNYYFLNEDPSKLIEILNLWKSKDPKLPYPGNGLITKMSSVKNYTYSYKFNGHIW